MRVKATKVGFYDGSRRRVGDEFEVADGETGSWFVPVATEDMKDDKPRLKAKAKGRGEEPDTLSEIARLDAEDQKLKGADTPA